MTDAKYAHVMADVAAGVTTRAAALALITAGELRVVNLKGYILTVSDFDDGEEAGL